MSFIKSYNCITRHVLARTPLLCICTDCERLVDSTIPGSMGSSGLAIIPEDMKVMEAGPPVVVYHHKMEPGLTIETQITASLPGDCAAKVLDFVKANEKANIVDLLRKLPAHLEDMNQRHKGMRILVLVYDLDVNQPRIRRCLLNHAKQDRPSTIALVASDAVEDPTLRTYMPVVNVERPSQAELQQLFESQLQRIGTEHKTELKLIGKAGEVSSVDVAKACSASLVGLHAPTALQVLALHMTSRIKRVSTKKNECEIDPIELSTEKAEILNKAGYVSLIQKLATDDEIGGLEGFKKWLHLRKAGFSPEAKEASLRPPRGVLLVGPPGTAKSLCAKLTATVFGMPLIRLDVGALFNSKLGDSERNIRNALAVADASAPCVLFVDEVN